MDSSERWFTINRFPVRRRLDPVFLYLFEQCIKYKFVLTPDEFHRIDLLEFGELILKTLSEVPAAENLPPNYHKSASLKTDILNLMGNLKNPHFDLRTLEPLFRAIMKTPFNDYDMWNEVDKLVEYSIYICGAELKSGHLVSQLRSVVGTMYVDVAGLFSAISCEIPDLKRVSTSFFKECTRDPDPRFKAEIGWTNWPRTITRPNLKKWLTEFTDQLAHHIDGMGLTPEIKKKLVVEPIGTARYVGSELLTTGIGFTTINTSDRRFYEYSDFLVMGVLRCDPDTNTSRATWHELSSYAKVMFDAHFTRRFALGFSLCGPIMRIFLFDRAGCVASQSFDINKDGKQFVDIMAAFLLMDDTHIGLDPTLKPSGQNMYFDVDCNGWLEHVTITHSRYIENAVAGSATKCWSGVSEMFPGIPLIIKDSWACSKKQDEGEMLQLLNKKGVSRIPRYCYHETVHVDGYADSTRDNVRKGLDVMNSKPPHIDENTRNSSPAYPGIKEYPSPVYHGIEECPPETIDSFRSHPSKTTNRIHRRLIMRDHGNPIHVVRSRSMLLNALAECIRGHRDIFKAGILHRDISIYNLLVEQHTNGSWSACVIDFDKAIQLDFSNLEPYVGTKPFMAIDVLMGHRHSFMHDLESFFWVLFWICVHVTEPRTDKLRPTYYQTWYKLDFSKLAVSKQRIVANDEIFELTAKSSFSEYLLPLIPCLTRLRRILFLGDTPVKENLNVYDRMCLVLEETALDFND